MTIENDRLQSVSGRKRPGNHSFGFRSITVGCRHAVYDDIQISFRENNVL